MSHLSLLLLLLISLCTAIDQYEYKILFGEDVSRLALFGFDHQLNVRDGVFVHHQKAKITLKCKYYLVFGFFFFWFELLKILNYLQSTGGGFFLLIWPVQVTNMFTLNEDRDWGCLSFRDTVV